MGGRGGSSHGGGNSQLLRFGIPNWPAAYIPLADWYANERKWAAFTSAYSIDPRMEAIIWDHRNGYVQTGNSFSINRRLYDPGNKGKSIEDIFAHDPSALRTVKTLDNAIAAHVSQRDSYFVRLESAAGLQADFGFSNAELSSMRSAAKRNALIGRESYQAAFTSVSAAADKNVFGGREFTRFIYVPKGTNIYGTANAVESEFILGRELKTRIMKIEENASGQIVVYEMIVGYGKK